MGKQIKMNSLRKDPCKFCAVPYCYKNVKSHEKACENRTPEERKSNSKGGRGKANPLLQRKQCQICLNFFSNISRHEKLCKPKQRKDCPLLCGANLLVRNLDKHLDHCKNNRSLKHCFLCYKLFLNEEQLENHIDQNHKEIFLEENDQNVEENGQNVKESDQNVKENDQNAVSKRSLESTCLSEAKKFKKNYNVTQVFKNKVIHGGNFYKNCTVGVPKEEVEKIKQNLDALNKECELEKCDSCPKIIKKNVTDHICEVNDIPDMEGPQQS